MIRPTIITLVERLNLEARLKETHSHLLLDWSPAFNHYYITNKENREKSGNIYLYELCTRVASGEFK